jgi:hypothetical protein
MTNHPLFPYQRVKLFSSYFDHFECCEHLFSMGRHPYKLVAADVLFSRWSEGSAPKKGIAIFCRSSGGIVVWMLSIWRSVI